MDASEYVDLQLQLASVALAVGAGKIDPDLARIADRLRAAESESLPAFILQRRLGLSDQAMRAVWTLTAIALDSNYRARVAQHVGANRITTDVLVQIAYEGSRRHGFCELGPSAPLRRLRVIERSDGGSPELHDTQWGWTVSRRVIAWLYGDTSVDAELFACRLSTPLPFDNLALASGVVEAAREALSSANTIVVATGSRGLGRRSMLVAAAQERQLQILEIDARALKDDNAEFSAIARECRLLDLRPLVRDIDALDGATQRRLVDHLGVHVEPILATSTNREARQEWPRPVIDVRVEMPPSKERAQHWRRVLLESSESDARYLAEQYPIAPALVERAAASATARAHGRAMEPKDIDSAIQSVLDVRLAGLARRLVIKQKWEDLVLAEEQLVSIRELVARVQRRCTVYEEWGFADKVGKGLGIAALFSGPPGTGKTMLAALIARELNLEVYVADSSKLVSKYIGETEKHLSDLFDAAEAAQAVILFDEADSLFGKRTELRSSNDRYANLETNYLLQRLESFNGICILTSNHEANIDPAFQRRLSLHLRLDLPDAAERAALWRAMIPASAPVDTVNFHNLARRFEMSGGYIKNAALRAAFLAADAGTAITEPLLFRSAEVEYEAMGKIS